MTHPRSLVVRFVRELRRSKRPVSGSTLCQRFGHYRMRTWGEIARLLRFEGVPVGYLAGRGYVLMRSRSERLACAERMRRAGRRQIAAAEALARGRSRQTTAAAVRASGRHP
jgi:biotin operon repressor